jgi:hypothetical protein
MHSNVPCTFDHRHGLAFELTCICSSAGPHFTHIFLHVCDVTYFVRSNAYTGLHSNSLAFVRAQSPLHTHTLSKNAIEHTYVRSIVCVFSFHVTLLGHPSPLFPFISISTVQPPPSFSSFSHLPHIQTLSYPKKPPREHHSIATALSPHRHSITAGHPIIPITAISKILSLKPTSPQIQFFYSIFDHSRAQIHSRIVPLECCVGSF